MQAPTINAQQAGLVATSADMNAYSQAAQFLLNPPMALAHAKTSVQSLTGGAANAIIWAQPARDNDGTWQAGSPDRFTVSTQGFYEVAAHAFTSPTAGTAECYFLVTTGTANPAGTGFTTSWWHSCGTAFTGNNLAVGAAGIIPVLLYPTDVLQFIVSPTTTCTTGNLLNYWGDWSHRLVSL